MAAVWPSVMTITLAGALALEGLIVLFFLLYAAHESRSTLLQTMPLQTHESRSMPLQTTRVHPSPYGSYRFTDKDDLPFDKVGVKDDLSRTMRDWTYE
jgi:hypothetical protein